MKDNRRNFIKKSVMTAAGVSVMPAGLFAQKVAPSDQVNVGLIGCRGKGYNLLRNHLNIPGVKVIGMADVDKNVLEERAGDVLTNFKQMPKLYGDYRKMLEDKDLDAVIIGTPDHWHCLNLVHACQAGKDVYVEKPLANSIEECNVMVAAKDRYNRVVQVGQQQRSMTLFNEIMDYIKSGKIGTLTKVNIWGNFDYGLGLPKVPDQPVPEGVDFDFWLGPAPDRTFNPSRFHGKWRHFWDYGGGLMTDWGVHLIDMALWAKDATYAPTVVMASGHNLTHLDHARETYETLSVVYKMKDYTINWDHTASAKVGPYGMSYGIEFIGDEGTVVADRSKYYIYAGGERIEKEMDKQDDHAENFIQCIKTRETPKCPIEAGRNVALYAHMGNIAVRSGENMLVWDEAKNKFTNSEKANGYIQPEYRKPWEFPKV